MVGGAMIRYEPQGPIKAQCPSEFVFKLQNESEKEERWVLYVDGSTQKWMRSRDSLGRAW